MSSNQDVKAQGSAGRDGNLALLDLEKALERTMGDKEFLQELFQEFLKNAPVDIKTIQNLIETKDSEGVRRQAHRLKGSAANLSFLKVAAIALQLEYASRDGDLAGSKNLLRELEMAIQETSAYLSKLS